MKILRISILLFTLSLSTLVQAANTKGQYSLCFTPGDNCTELIIQQIQAAKTSIYLQAYSFTATSIAKALVKARNKGVKVRVLVDKSQRTPNPH